MPAGSETRALGSVRASDRGSRPRPTGCCACAGTGEPIQPLHDPVRVSYHRDHAMPNAAEACDLLIDGGLVLTLDAADRIIADGAVAITADRIVAVETATVARERF